MGGAVGSVKHVWEFGNLQFRELIDLFEGILQGSVDAVEKTDGLPIVWRWDGNSVLWGRSTADVRAGGYLHEDFLLAYSSFPGIDLLRTGTEVFERECAPRLAGLAGFPEWIDSELFSPVSPQLIRSDFYALVMHRSFGVDDSESDFDPFPEVRRRIGKMQPMGEDVDGGAVRWRILFSADMPARARTGADTRTIIRGIEDSLGTEIQKFGVDLENTIDDWVFSAVKSSMRLERPQMDDNALQLYAAAVALPDDKNAVAALKARLKRDFPDLKSLGTKTDLLRTRKAVLQPLVSLLKRLGAKFISALQPTLVEEGNYEAVRDEIQTGVRAAIDIIQSDPEKLERAAKSIQSLQGYEDLISPYEGFVTKRGEDLMKVTGIFHDAGTIKKLGRKDLSQPIDWEAADTVVSIFPMAAKPTHAGHWDMIEGIAKIVPTNPVTGKRAKHIVKVVVSESERARPGEVQISPKQSLIYWNQYLKPYLPENVEIVSAKGVSASIGYIVGASRENPMIFGIWIWSGDKDAGRFSAFEDVEGVRQPRQAEAERALGRKTTQVSGTLMRKWLGEGNREEFMARLPGVLSPSEREEVWDLFSPAV
jgi:hypothetical protein